MVTDGVREGGLDGGMEGVCPLGGVAGGGVFSREDVAGLRWGFFGGLSGGFSCVSVCPLIIILAGLVLLLFLLLDHIFSCCGFREEAFVDEDDLLSRLSVRTNG